MYSAAAARLVDRVVTGGNGVLLVAGNPGSGRSHTLWGGATIPSAAAERGVLPLALADLARRWRSGNGSPFCSSPQRSLAAAAFVVRLCAAELCTAELCCGVGEATRDLFRDDGNDDSSGRLRSSPAARAAAVDGKHSISGGGGSIKASSPARWAFSARGILASLSSSSRKSFGGDAGDAGGGGGGGSDGAGMNGGSARRRSEKGGAGAAAAAAAAVLMTSRVLVGVREVTVGGVEEALAMIQKVSENVNILNLFSPGTGSSIKLCAWFLPDDETTTLCFACITRSSFLHRVLSYRKCFLFTAGVVYTVPWN